MEVTFGTSRLQKTLPFWMAWTMMCELPGMSTAAEAKKWKIARSFPRFAIDVAVMISGGSAGERKLGRIADIGLGGLCALLPEQTLLAGERLWVEFQLPQAAEPLRVLAKVKYVTGERHGLQFLTLTPYQREQIRSTCENLIIV
jgi:hypothetical protein